MIGKKPRPDAEIIVHVRHDPLHVVLHRVDSRVRGAEPELLVGVQAEIAGDVENAFQRLRQSLPPPPRDRLVHHMAHSQRGKRSTACPSMTARKRSTWCISFASSIRLTGQSSKSWSAVACHRFGRAEQAERSVIRFRSLRLSAKPKRWQATALQDTLPFTNVIPQAVEIDTNPKRQRGR